VFDWTVLFIICVSNTLGWKTLNLSCMSVLTIHMEQLSFHRIDISWCFFKKSVKNTQVPLNSNKNATYFTWSSTYIYNNILLNFLEWEMFQTKVAEKIETHILCLIPFLWKLCHLWHNTEKYGTAREVTGDNIMQHMCFACQITDARIQTYTQNMYYLMLFEANNGYANAWHCYIIHCLSY